MSRNAVKALSTAAALALLAGAACAGTSPFTLVSGAYAPGVNVTLTVQASTIAGYDFDFVISNSSSVGTVTGVYFENDWASMLAGVGSSSGPASYLTGALSPQIDGWDGSMESHTVAKERVRTWEGRRYYDTYVDVIADGLKPGFSQIFSFKADGSLITLADLEAALGTEGMGIAIRLQDLLVNDPQAAGFGEIQDKTASLFAFVLPATVIVEDPAPPVTGVPTPTAALAGLVMLGAAAMRRRRD